MRAHASGRGRSGATLLIAAFALAPVQAPSASASPAARGGAARPSALPPAARSGRSVDGRPLRAIRLGATRRGRPLLVVGSIHGDESAGIAIARDLIDDGAVWPVPVWVVPDLNPDGTARGTRQDARGVDLNRNFPYRWRAAGRPSDPQYPGPVALSEPESRFACRLVARIRPAVTIWFHQHLDLVDRSGGDPAVERAYARLVQRPLVRLPRYPGSVAGWQDHVFPGSTAFVVELPAGTLDRARVERYSDAILALARAGLPHAADTRRQVAPDCSPRRVRARAGT
jgi:protein MpaA